MLKLKVFSGYADSVENAFNAWMTSGNYSIVAIHTGDLRLYIFYKEG